METTENVISEKIYKIERDNNQAYDGSLTTLKIEIKDEPKQENTFDEFEYLEFLENTEVEQDEYQFKLFEEQQTRNYEGK
ncbi:unnamed protein product [Diabrotica balteata]|uniref:Uncharacterized protein n=1 Tax=Diabrotica balteata TaxID=107213 RepID=A0A9N9SUB8_DIABA|nr:unnamed protein product [Diabrotica balteata]